MEIWCLTIKLVNSHNASSHQRSNPLSQLFTHSAVYLSPNQTPFFLSLRLSRATRVKALICIQESGFKVAPVRALFATPQNAPPAERICILCTSRLASFVRRESKYLPDCSQLMRENTIQSHISTRICHSSVKFGSKSPPRDLQTELTKGRSGAR